MGLFDTIFGSPSKSTATSTPIDMQAPQFTALRGPFADLLSGLMGGGSQGLNPVGQVNYPVAPMGASEMGAMVDVNAMAMDPARRALLTQTLGGNFLPGQPGGNPFLQAAITAAQQPTMEALQHAVGRQIPGMFAAAGHQGSSRLGTGSTARDLQIVRGTEAGARALGDIATNMSNQAYQFERGQQTQAMQLGQQEVQQAIANFQAQQLPRLIQQMGIDQGTAAGQQMLQSWLQAIQLFGGVTAPAVANQGQSTSTGASPGLFGQLFPKGIYNPAMR